MTSDERAQLIEDIKKCDNYRRGLIERAEGSKDFDIPSAWEEIEDIEKSIYDRIVKVRSSQS